MATTVVGLFDDRETAQTAVRDLIDAGFRRQDISVVAADPGGKLYKQHVDDQGNSAGEGAATGLASGAVVGGLLGLLIGAGLIFVPVGVFAAGPIAGLIAGGAAGAATGGILGGLIGLGIPKEEADVYAESVRRGGTLVTVSAEDADASRAHSILDRDGAVDIEERAAAYRAQGFTAFDPNAPVYQEEETIQERQRYQAPVVNTAVSTSPATPAATNLNENERLEVVREDLAVGKREVERGGVRIRSYVTERPVSEQVTLREEHVDIQRTPVDRVVDPSAIDAFQERTVEVREHAEIPVVAKEAHVIEEISVGKTAEQRTETVSDTVRETHVDVERIADEDFYRNHYSTNFAATGGTYESYRPAYEFGGRQASEGRFRGRSYSEIENDLRSDYERQYPGQYANHRNAIQTGYDRAASTVRTGGTAYADNPAGVLNGVPGIQTGGRNADGSPDSRGITEKIADTLTGDRIDDKTGRRTD
ncbi:MAG: DUF2382 domain-containing protein [Fimbriimonas sp.]